MLKIKFYRSLVDKEPAEVHETGLNLHDWLCANVPNYESTVDHPIMIEHDGQFVPTFQWKNIVSGEASIRVKPQGGGFGNILNIFFPVFAIANAIFGALAPSLSGNRGGQQGQGLPLALIRANQARLGQVVPENAGRYRIYPDYILPIHRYFVDKRTQAIELMCSVGIGKHQINAGQRYVGDTPVISLGASAESNVYQPGEDVSGDPAAVWWHSVKEVGQTATGGAGLQLSATFPIEPDPNAASYFFDGLSVSIPDGAGEFPTGWESGLLVRIEQFLDYEVVSGSPRSIIRGNLDQLEPFNGMVIEIVGDNEGLYKIHEFTPYSPEVMPVAGSASTLTGSAAPARFDFDVTPASFDVLLDGNTYPVSLTTDVTNLSGLLSAINSALGAAPIVASDSGGNVRLTEQTPFSGEPISVTGDTVDVFGASPVGVTGTATVEAAPEQLAQITLSFDDGSPVGGLVTGTRRMAIGYRGLLYRTTSGSISTITVERLTDTGATDADWVGFDPIITNDATLRLDDSTQEGAWTGPFPSCPEGEMTDLIEIDTFFPTGLIELDGKGNPVSRTVRVETQWRDMDVGGAWNSFITTYTDTTRDQIGFTAQFSTPMMRSEVRRRRIGAESTWVRTQDKVVWYGLKSRLNGPTSYPRITTISLKVNSTDRLAAQTDNQFSCIATRVLPVRTGGAWDVETPTRNIAPFVIYALKSMGYTDDQIDLARFDALDALWASRGDFYDWQHEQGTLRGIINQALRAGFAEMVVENGKVRPLRDQPRTIPEQAYSPQNGSTRLIRTNETVNQNDFDGVDVEFNSALTWSREVVECRLNEDEGRKVLKVTLEGITNRDKAYRIGMRIRRGMKYITKGYTFGTELEGLNSRAGSYVAIFDDVPGYGRSSLFRASVLSGGFRVITVSEPPDWTGGPHIVGFRRADGTLQGPFTATQGDTKYQIKLASSVVPPAIVSGQEPPHVYFGETSRWMFPAIVKSIKPAEGNKVSIQAVNYDERLYLDDDSLAP